MGLNYIVSQAGEEHCLSAGAAMPLSQHSHSQRSLTAVCKGLDS